MLVGTNSHLVAPCGILHAAVASGHSASRVGLPGTLGRRTCVRATASSAMSFKKDEEVSFRHDKTAVIQEARMFNQSNISPRRCRILLTKILYLLYTGERFSQQEATDLFFGATKLFQNKDAGLRQMVYLAIKELAPYAQDVIMAMASIMKDMQPNTCLLYTSPSPRD